MRVQNTFLSILVTQVLHMLYICKKMYSKETYIKNPVAIPVATPKNILRAFGLFTVEQRTQQVQQQYILVKKLKTTAIISRMPDHPTARYTQ